MRIASFLPLASANYLRHFLQPEEMLFARSWDHLESCLSTLSVFLALVDPCADGRISTDVVARMLGRNPAVPFVAYVPLTPENMKAILGLSSLGLSDALLHPLRDPVEKLRELTSKVHTRRLTIDFLRTMENNLGRLDPVLQRAVHDLFERPRRYVNAADIGVEADISMKRVYRAFAKASLASPKKFVIAAKVLRGYASLRGSSDSIRSVSLRLGYPFARGFSEQIIEVFNCPPSRLRTRTDSTEVVAELRAWLNKS